MPVCAARSGDGVHKGFIYDDSIIDCMARESMQYDVVIVGAGPAGLAAAIRLKQLSGEIPVCVLEKGSEVGAHILSGAVMDPRALAELVPDWKGKGAPLHTPVSADRFLFLTESSSFATPGFLLPACFRNHGNYVVSLGNVCRWLAKQAEELGVEIFPGFAAADLLYDERGAVRGVATGDLGVDRKGAKTDAYQPGMELHAKYTFLAEGCRGHLGRQLEARYALRAGADPQVFGIGLKELWEVKPGNHRPGLVVHTAGWPLDSSTYGGARAITAGGLQSLPKLTFPGGCLIGDDAGFLNASRIKGSHCAIKSGMLAAEAAAAALKSGRAADELSEYPQAFRASWLHEELNRARNFKPWMSKGLYFGSLMFGIDQVLLRGRAPWTLHHGHADHETLRKKTDVRPIEYPKPDGVLTFDRLTNVAFSNTNHNEEQPCHLTLKDASVPVRVNLELYDAPEQRYCPAGVYEIVRDADGSNPRLQINAQNCVHCKTCDIKDPAQNIVWIAPEGGGGPNYPNM